MGEGWLGGLRDVMQVGAGCGCEHWGAVEGESAGVDVRNVWEVCRPQ